MACKPLVSKPNDGINRNRMHAGAKISISSKEMEEAKKP